jgi:hypothetical protein
MALATGAGKTITSLYAATKMFEGLKRLFVVISVPYASHEGGRTVAVGAMAESGRQVSRG